MADYIYLLEHRLSAPQRAALSAIRDVARSEGLTVFLVGGAVRDLTSGSPVPDLDVVVQGNALKLKKKIELAGGTIAGEMAAGQALFVRFPGGARVEVGSTLSATYPKPGKPVMKPATLLDDLRRRDFTANAMALSLNEGSYGLLMDPLNGVADIENRQLRLVSNYGFIEDPVRMIRAARFQARLGWTMDEKTQARYDTGKQEHYIAALSAFHRGYEAEEIFHEEDPLRILHRLEEEGWMKVLAPALTVAGANVAELDRLREVQTQLQMRGIHPEPAAAHFPLLTAKLSPQQVAELKHSFVRPGFVAEIDALEGAGKELAGLLSGKGAATPSQSWKLMEAAQPEALLWVAFTSKNAALQAKLKSFYTDWPQARTRIPYTLMQEMRIVPELAGYNELVDKLFFELMDGNLGSVEEMKAFLETYSPPAPPPPIHLRRPRAPKKDAKSAKSRKKVVSTESDAKADAAGSTAESVAPAEAPELTAGAMPDPLSPSPQPARTPQKQPVAKPSKGVSPAKDATLPVANPTPAATAPVKMVRPTPVKAAAVPAKVPAKTSVPSPVKHAAPTKKVAPVPATKKSPQAPAKKVVSVKPAPAKAAPAKAPPPKTVTRIAPGAASKTAAKKVVPPSKADLAKRRR